MEHITLGHIQQIIVFLATFLTSGGIILSFALKSVNKVIKRQLEPIVEDNKKIHEELKQNSLDTMRIAICSDELPLKERLDIGKRYIESGGNGSVKVVVHSLEKKYEEELKKEGKIWKKH